MISRQQAINDFGFKPIPHFTIGDALILELGRERYLSFSSLETPNEMIFICQSSDAAHKDITDLICVHNYDYDGYISSEKLTHLINGLVQSNK